MEKTELIKRITDIIKLNGCFSVGELEYETNGVVVGELGKFVGVAEFFNEDHADINVYEPSSFSSDEIDSYEEQYEDLSEDVLSEIHFICEQWEAECIRFQVGDFVLVPNPNKDDLHNHEFLGVIKVIKGEYATVEDMDGDCFDIELDRLEHE